jgi:hypothetical protein
MRPLILTLGTTLLAGTPALATLGLAPLTIVALLALAGLAGCVLIGALLRRIWAREEQRTIEKHWLERERLLDTQRSGAAWPEFRERRSRPGGPRDAARVLYIVARDQPELFAFLRRDFAAEEAEGVIEILMNRRHGAQPCEADERDPRRNGAVAGDLRELGFAFVRQQTPLLQGLASGLAPHPRG